MKLGLRLYGKQLGKLKHHCSRTIGRKVVVKITRMLIALSILSALPQMPSPLNAEGTTRTIEVHARRFAFQPAEITVKAGETVKLELDSDDVPHDLVVRSLGIDQTIKKGHPAEVTFTASTPGDFHGECGRFCGSGHGAMLFTVHVKQD